MQVQREKADLVMVDLVMEDSEMEVKAKEELEDFLAEYHTVH